MFITRRFATAAVILAALVLPTPLTTLARGDEDVVSERDGGQDESLISRVSRELDADPSPEDVKTAMIDAGASDVNVGPLVVGSTVARPSAVRSPASMTDASLTINEEAMRRLDATPTPDELREALVAAGATDVSISPARSDAGRVAQTKVPSDAFTVSSLWADYTGSAGKKHVVFYGFWNFRDEFIGTGDPNDGSAVQLDGFNTRCWTKVSADVVVKDYRGDVHGHGIMRTDAQQKSVFGIDDRTSDFMMLTDNGIHAVDMRRDKIGCNARRAASYFYEHNLGGGGWSASLSMAAFSLSYSGSSGQTLQKAAAYNYYN
jgi:hypothetical protein